MKKRKIDILRIISLAAFFVVGWVTMPLIISGSRTGIQGLIGMLAVAIGAGFTGYRLGKELVYEQMGKLMNLEPATVKKIITKIEGSTL